VVYTPTVGFMGTDTFTYTVSDGNLTDDAIVTIIVSSTNTPPTISNIPDQTTDMNTPAGPVPFTVWDSETPADALVLSSESSNVGLVPDGNIVFGGSGTDRTVTIIPTNNVSGTATITVTVDDGRDIASDSFELRVAVGEPPGIFMYLPLLFKHYVGAPDLQVQRIVVTSRGVEVVVKNQGNTPVTDEFWVDVYINPSLPPSAVNQSWDQLCSQGLVWGVTESALPVLVPGGALTLTIGDDYFVEAYSLFDGALAAGTQVYAQVDSYNANTNYGAVLEGHEITGGDYNNITGPVVVTGTSGETGEEAVGSSVTDDPDLAPLGSLPYRQ
jgi:hypothetical protein